MTYTAEIYNVVSRRPFDCCLFRNVDYPVFPLMSVEKPLFVSLLYTSEDGNLLIRAPAVELGVVDV